MTESWRSLAWRWEGAAAAVPTSAEARQPAKAARRIERESLQKAVVMAAAVFRPPEPVSGRAWRCDTLSRGMAATGYAGEEGRLQARVDVDGTGAATVDTGVPVLDHLLGLLAEHAAFDLALEVAPGEPDAEVAAAGRALGQALSDALHAESVRGYGSAAVPADEALAH